MDNPRFIQIHSLHGWAGTLLNRDDTGFAKRLRYGGSTRTRVSSQCLKRHWRLANGPHALVGINGATAATRSREIVTRRVVEPLRKAGHPDDVVDTIGETLQKAVYGDKGHERGNRQPLLLGDPEIRHLAEMAKSLAELSPEDRKTELEELGKPLKSKKPTFRNFQKNMAQMRAQTKLPGGLVGAMFGRMVTSDLKANIDAAIHVAHAFTVHPEEQETDYFTAVDDLAADDESGAGHVGDSDLTSGLFYGYVVVDLGTLFANIPEDRETAGEVVRRLIHLIATITPGAKLGSTAPYTRASFMMVEAGAEPPRSLAEAFRQPSRPNLADAAQAIAKHVEALDDNYGVDGERRVMSLNDTPMPRAMRVSLPALADWAGDIVQRTV